jgi:phage tail-like protein
LLSGLAWLEDGYLVAGLPANHQLLILDLYALDGGPLNVPLPEPGVPLDPGVPLAERYLLATHPEGGLWVLDRAARQLWQLSADLNPVPITRTLGTRMTFQPTGALEERRTVAAATGHPIALAPVTQDAIAIAPLPDGSCWLLDRGIARNLLPLIQWLLSLPQPVLNLPQFVELMGLLVFLDAHAPSVLWLYRPPYPFTPIAVPLFTQNLIATGADDLRIQKIRGNTLAYVPDRDPQGHPLPRGRLFIADVSGNQAYGIAVQSLPDPATPAAAIAPSDLVLRLQRQAYYPLRYFAGTALVATTDQVYYHQTHRGSRWLALQPLPKQRYETRAEIGLPGAVRCELNQTGFDGREPGCVWHRLCLDAQIPPGTQVTVKTRTAEVLGDWSDWRSQPSPYRRPLGSEVPFTSLWSDTELADPHTGTWELLLQQTAGRFLQLCLTLEGNGLCTPKLRAVRIHYPRFSYLKAYLPAIYQQDRDSMQFLEQFLANPEGLFTTIEGMIAQMQFLLDVKTVPTDALDWLASWLGLLLQPAWSEYQRRLMLAHTPYFFQRRGTLAGVMQAVLLTVYPELGPAIFQDAAPQLNVNVRIVEQFLTRTRPAVAVGDPTGQTQATSGFSQEDAKVRAHRFTVMVPTTVTPETLGLVERIVALEKPAHTAFTVKQYWALFRVGEIRVGLDTVLGQRSAFAPFRLGQTALAEGALGDRFPYTLTTRTVITH